jgi:hypothetical protein
MSFAINMSKWTEKTKQSIDHGVREVIFTVAGFVDERSPVGNRELWADNISRAERGLPPRPAGYIGGHFRANNQYHFGAPPDNEVDGVDPDGGMTLAKIKAGVLSSPVAGIHWIANNVPYAMALENGHSKQQPEGIYKLAVMDAEAVIRSIL